MRFPRRDDRGQIIVVAALLIAVLFVGLALVLNSAIYTENLANRGETSTNDAMTISTVTEERVQRTIHTANYYSDEVSFSNRRSLVHNNVSGWDRLAGVREARIGHLYSIKETGLTEGTRVIQKNQGGFMPADEDIVEVITGLTLDPLGIEDRTTWIPAPNSTTRDFEVTVNRSSLKETDQSLLDQLGDFTDEVLTGSSSFWIQTQRVDNEENMWRVYLVNDTTNESVAAVVTEIEGGGDGEESVRAICRAEGDSVTVELTKGRLVGEGETTNCPGLTDAFGGERNNVYFVGADEVAGSYQFMTDVSEDEFENRVNHANSDEGLLGSILGITGDLLDCVFTFDCNFNPTIYSTIPSESDPYTTTAIYDVTIETTYQDDRITYTRNVTFPPTAG